MIAAVILLLIGRNERWLVPLVFGGACIDILAATLATHALPPVAAGIAMMLLFNVAAAAILLPLRYGMTVAGLSQPGAYHGIPLVKRGQRRGAALDRRTVDVHHQLPAARSALGHQIGHRARSSQRLGRAAHGRGGQPWWRSTS